MKYRVPFAPDRKESRFKARLQFIRYHVHYRDFADPLMVTPKQSLAIEFEAETLAQARHEVARRIRPLDPRPVRGLTLLTYASASYRAQLPDWEHRREWPAPAWWDDGAVLALTRKLPLFAPQVVADLIGD